MFVLGVQCELAMGPKTGFRVAAVHRAFYLLINYNSRFSRIQKYQDGRRYFSNSFSMKFYEVSDRK